MYSLELPCRSDSKEFIQHTVSKYDERSRIILNTLIFAVMEIFLGTRERVGNSRGKGAVSVRTIEASVYFLSVWTVRF